MRETSGKVNILIIVLIGIILIAGIVLVLKMTGVIKKSETQKVEENNETNIIKYEDYFEFKEKLASKAKVAKIEKTIVSVISFAISMVVTIGICKLYSKLQLPFFVLVFTFLNPIISIIEDNISGLPAITLSIILAILSMMSLYHYYKAVGMSGLWAIIPAITIITAAFGISNSMFSFSNNTSRSGRICNNINNNIICNLGYFIH